jgi:tetratricopeptide (TPR) repeat protein
VRRSVILVVSLLLGAAGASHAQEPASPPSPSKLYESGQYEAAASQVQQRLEEGDVPPGDLFWAAQAMLRAGHPGEARALIERLGGNEDDPWSAVRQSALALLEGDPDGAARHATRGTELAPDLFHAHYQLGRARHEAQQWPAAAAAFARAAELDGNAAYAHYYAGVAYNRLKRIDPMAAHFRRFLELAPSAPEREQVEQLLKLLKGLR